MSNPIIMIARQEFTLNLRNRWIVSFAGLFMLLTLLTAYFGMVTSGYAGFQDFIRTSASLINLSGFLVPLFALILGVFNFIGSREYLQLLITQPLSRSQLLLGKFLGLSATITCATLLGFGLPGVIISLRIGSEGAVDYLVVIGLSLMLGIVFLGISLLISLLSRLQQIAMGAAIGVWLFFELFYGLLVLGSTLYLPHSILKSSLVALLAGNPIDIVRVVSLLKVGGPHFFGAAGASLLKLTGSTAAAGMWGMIFLSVWLIVPLAIAVVLFRKQDI